MAHANHTPMPEDLKAAPADLMKDGDWLRPVVEKAVQGVSGGGDGGNAGGAHIPERGQLPAAGAGLGGEIHEDWIEGPGA